MIETAEFVQRRENLLAALDGHEVDALLVSGLPNIRYLSGFTGSNALLLLAQGSATLFTDPRYTLQATSEAGGCRVVTARKSLYEVASSGIRRKHWRRIGLERGRLTYSAYAELQEHAPLNVTLQPLPPVVERLRMIKSAAEVELIRKSVDTNSRAYERALARLRGGWTENDLAAEIDYQMRRFGAEGVAFESIVAVGRRSALPHARPTGEPIGTNRLLLMDIGASRTGYCSDMTRVVHLGAPGNKAKKLYGAVLESQLAAIDAVRENVTAETVDRAARKVLKRHGLDRYFVHSTGHGLGLEIHEPPRLGKNDKTPLAAGMVVTIEPGAYIPDFGGVRIEDTVVVTKTGCEILTPTSKELRVIEPVHSRR